MKTQLETIYNSAKADIENAKTSLDTDDQLAVYALNARQDEADRFSRKLHDWI